MTRRTFVLPADLRSALAFAAEELGSDAYVVGGSLRDLLIGRPVKDLDLAVRAGSARAATRAPVRGLAERLGGHYVLLDEARGIERILLDEGALRQIDVAPLRGDTIEADLARRDYTIDAIAAPLRALAASARTGARLGAPLEPIDPHGGVADLETGTVRLIAEDALIDDPLRLLRAVRLAVQLDFTIAPETAAALRRHAGRVFEPAAERIRDELMRCFETPRSAQALRLMDGLGLLDRLLPEVTAGRGVTQPKEHYYDVFDHAVETVAALDFMLSAEGPTGGKAPLWRALWGGLQVQSDGLRRYLAEEPSEGRSRATLLKLAGLLHDVAKPETRAPDGTGRIRFFGHAERGAETARRIMQRLRFSRREIELVSSMVEEHLRPAQLSSPGELPTRRALYRFFRDTREAAESVLLLSLADALAARGPDTGIEAWRGYVAYIAHILARRDEDLTIVRPARLLTGSDLMAELGIAPGPEVGRLLAQLEEAQASGEIASRDDAIDYARRLHGAPFRRATVEAIAS